MEEAGKRLDNALLDIKNFFEEEELTREEEKKKNGDAFLEFASSVDINTLREVFLAEILNQKYIINPFELMPKLNKDIKKLLEEEFLSIQDKINAITWTKMISHTTVDMMKEVVSQSMGFELDKSFIEGMKLNPSSPKEYLLNVRESIGQFIGENETHTLCIWTRDNCGEPSPTHILVGYSYDDIKNKFHEYLVEHRNEEDYLDDEQYDNILGDIDGLFEHGAPELNCVYVLKYKS